jgi:hypothetical protein
MAGTSEGEHPNQLGVTHCGLVILERPSKILSIIDRKMSGQIPSDYPVNIALLDHVKRIIEQEYHPSDAEPEQLAAFCYSSGYIKIGLFGGMITPLRWELTEFKQNFYIRNTRTPYPRKFTRAFIRATLGMPYVAANLWELVSRGECLNRFMRAIHGKGSDDYVPRMWCSELVARFYGIPHPSAVVPSQLSSQAGDDAVGSDLFEPEIPMKISYDVSSLINESRQFVTPLRCILSIASLYDPSLRN